MADGRARLDSAHDQTLHAAGERKGHLSESHCPERSERNQICLWHRVAAGTTRVVHHANVVLARTRTLRKRDGEDGRPGFAGMDVITEAAAGDFDPDSHFLFWKPGAV